MNQGSLDRPLCRRTVFIAALDRGWPLFGSGDKNRLWGRKDRSWRSTIVDSRKKLSPDLHAKASDPTIRSLVRHEATVIFDAQQETMRIAIGNDHAGTALKKHLVEHLQALGYQTSDLGAATEESVDYPDFAHPVAEAVSKGDADLGILICGSGNGVNMAANRHIGIRAALAWNSEVAKLARTHNDANVLSVPARFVDEAEAERIVDAFLASAFEGGRHQRRVEKIETR